VRRASLRAPTATPFFPTGRYCQQAKKREHIIFDVKQHIKIDVDTRCALPG
jgi:hypothetical protein